MDLRRLRYFVAVAEEGHVTRASERLGMAQAPLSQQIKTLEREMGAQLFRRRPRGVELTDAGAALLVEARAILARIVDAEAVVRRAARGEEGRVPHRLHQLRLLPPRHLGRHRRLPRGRAAGGAELGIWPAPRC